MDLQAKSDAQLDQLIANHEAKPGGTSRPLYPQLLEERARRAQAKQLLNLEASLKCLMEAARNRTYVSYGQLAAASRAEWIKARQQMNGAKGHLELLLDLCHARGLPLLTAICVNQENLSTGELGEAALAGFAAGARRLGRKFADPLAFHHQCRADCLTWGEATKP